MGGLLDRYDGPGVGCKRNRQTKIDVQGFDSHLSPKYHEDSDAAWVWDISSQGVFDIIELMRHRPGDPGVERLATGPLAQLVRAADSYGLVFRNRLFCVV